MQYHNVGKEALSLTPIFVELRKGFVHITRLSCLFLSGGIIAKVYGSFKAFILILSHQ